MDNDRIVVMQNALAKILCFAKDLGQLQTNLMDWLMKNIGYSNVALWLASEDEDMELGSYMKYTIPGCETENGRHLSCFRQELWPHVRENNRIIDVIVTESEFPHTVGMCEKFLNMEVLACNFLYIGESMGMIAVFREKPFCPEDVAAMEIVETLFPASLASMITQEKKKSSKKPRAKKDPADWWKRGDKPPF
jgi:hypothetical protein